MNKREQKIQEDELKSLAAYEALQAHEQTRADMEARFLELDEQAIEAARELPILRAAGSAKAGVVEARLHTLRARRDRVRTSWNAERNRLETALEIENSSSIAHFCEISWMRIHGLEQKRELVILGRDEAYVGGPRFRVRTNFVGVNAAISGVLRDMRAVKDLHCKPLQEINERIAEADRAYEDLVFDLQEVNVSEQEVAELHEIVNQPENPRSVDRRPLYPAKEIYAR